MPVGETTLQTRVPESLQQELKMCALRNQVLLKEEITSALSLFLSEQPWLSGTWIKQPKSTEFKQITVKVPASVGDLFEAKAIALEVSTSSLAYTAFDWHVSKNKTKTAKYTMK